jgi:cytochrome c553
MRTLMGLVASLAAVCGAWPAGAQDDARLKALGQHRAQECTSCHRIDGLDNGIPPIIGWDVESFVTTLAFYKNGQRTNPVMVSVTQLLSAEDMRALAIYFASVPKPKAKGSTPKRK